MLLGSDNRLKITEDSISKLENIAVEIIQKKPQSKDWKNNGVSR